MPKRNPVPVWARAILALDRARGRVESAAESARDELMVALLDRPARDAVNRAIYERATTYLPAGRTFEAGLLAWEEDAIATAPFPRSGRLLLGGAGGGREIRALARVGYSVLAFEPTDLVEGALAVARDLPGVEVVRGSYADVVAAARGAGPLRAWVGQRFDGVLCAWASFSYVGDAVDRVELLRALVHIAPSAPVVVSYFAVRHEPPRDGRARTLARTVLSSLGAHAPHGLEYSPALGFVHRLSREQIRSDAAAAGYDVVRIDDSSHAWALLAPLVVRGARNESPQ